METKQYTFDSNGNTLTGYMYLPEGFSEDTKHPAAIVTGAWTTSQHQMAETYAKKLAENGIIGVTFDFSSWGESEGEPRYMEDPKVKTSDIVNAAAYLKGLEFVDSDKLYGLGVCASSGYMTDAALEGHFAKIAVVAPWLHNKDLAETIYGGEEGVQGLIDASRDAEEKQKKGEDVVIEGASKTNEDALMGDFDYYANPERGAIEAWDNKWNMTSWEKWLTYDPISRAEQQNTPILLVHSESAMIPDGARTYHEKVSSEKKMIWMDDVTQDMFYDDQEVIDKVIPEVTNWFVG